MGELISFLTTTSSQFRVARLPSLYSDFTPLRSSNPDGYAANISAWLNALQSATKAGKISTQGSSPDRFSFTTGEELLQALETREHGRPLALKAVIDEAVSKQQMIVYEQFQTSPYSIYDKRWTVRPRWMLSWVVRQFGIWDPAQSDGKLPNARYAIIANLEEAADQILNGLASRVNIVDQIFSRDAFRQLAAQTLGMPDQLSPYDTELLLTHLHRDRKAISYDSRTINFTTQSSLPEPLTDQDHTIASLKTLLQSVSQQISSLEARITALTLKAQQSISSKNKPSALAALRSKRLAEANLTQRHTILSQLEDVYSKIEQAADQAAIVKVMEGSTSVLRNLQKQTGKVEKVEEIIEDLREEMTKVDEVGAVLNEAGSTGGMVVDDDELDEELEAMKQQQDDEVTDKARKEEQTQAQLATEEELRRRHKEAEKQQQQQQQEKDSKKQKQQELEERVKKFGLLSNTNTSTQEEEADLVDIDHLTRRTSDLSVQAEEEENDGHDDTRVPLAEQ